jgi:hypothetical protein
VQMWRLHRQLSDAAQHTIGEFGEIGFGPHIGFGPFVAYRSQRLGWIMMQLTKGIKTTPCTQILSQPLSTNIIFAFMTTITTRRQRIPEEQWAQHKTKIRRLYLEDDRHLEGHDGVMDLMLRQDEFYARYKSSFHCIILLVDIGV